MKRRRSASAVYGCFLLFYCKILQFIYTLFFCIKYTFLVVFFLIVGMSVIRQCNQMKTKLILHKKVILPTITFKKFSGNTFFKPLEYKFDLLKNNFEGLPKKLFNT